MKNIDKLKTFLPPDSIPLVEELICDKDDLEIHVTKPRFSKWGDFRKNSRHYLISLNSNLNPYQFLITLLHEYAHYAVHKKHGNKVKPHGKEWKQEFRQILNLLLEANNLPYDLSQAIANYSLNPRAAITTDLNLKKALEKFSYEQHVMPTYLSDLKEGDTFIFNGRIFERLEKRRKLIKCRDTKKDKFYLFQPDTVVKKI
jgi:hypothetical protein